MLEQFGLSTYENKVYLTLLELGVVDARTISAKSGVPYGRIYDVLDTLKHAKLIIENAGRPKKYGVVEPEIALSRLLEQRQQEVERLEKAASIAIQKLNKVYEQQPRDQLLWKVAIGEDMYSTYFELLSEARSSFKGYIEVSGHLQNTIDYMAGYRSAMSQMADRGVNVKVLLGTESPEILYQMIDKAPELLELVTKAEIRITPTISHPFTILDNEKVILKVPNPTDTDQMVAAIYLKEKSLSVTLKDKFNEIWTDAQPLRLSLNTEKIEH